MERIHVARSIVGSGLVAVVVLLGGCTVQQLVAPVPRSDSIRFTVAEAPRGNSPMPIHNAAIGDNAAVGGGSGLVAGGLAGLGCGPLAVLCVPLGATVGMITGGAAGAVVGSTARLTPEKAGLLRDRMIRLLQDHPVSDDLRRNLVERAGRYWDVTPDHAAVDVNVQVQTLELTSTRDGRLRLSLLARVTIQRQAATKQARSIMKTYRYDSPYAVLSAWTDTDSDFVETSLASASQQMAAQLIADLSPR